MQLYPIKFKPIPKETIWGGNKLTNQLNKSFSPNLKIGESWELSGVENNISIVDNGPLQGLNLQALIEQFKAELLGVKVLERFGEEFPLLIKFIDANDALSIQVHPDDELAQKRHNSKGKTEMWYLIDAEQESELIVGFNQELTREHYLKTFAEGQIKSILNSEKVKKGDCFFIPAGRVHAIGKDILLAEIQQTSDITYRMYDWDRKDSEGNYRELHTELAPEAIDYTFEEDYSTQYEDKLNESVDLVQCNYFTTNKWHISQAVEMNYSSLDSFVIYMCLEGELMIEYANNEKVLLSKGETVLIPAGLKDLILKPWDKAELLEVYI